jgi:hypothetical protein
VPWTWERIEQEWLGESRVAHISEVVIDCFNEVERVLGPEWIEAKHERGLVGSMPAASIVGVGQQLLTLRNAANADTLLDGLRDGKTSAWAELAGIYAVCGTTPDIEIEIGPEIQVSGQARKPDFRSRRGGEVWTYVEVSRPSTSAERIRLDGIMNQVVTVLTAVDGHYALEVYLRREPNDAELQVITKRGTYLCGQPGSVEEPLPDQLGLLVTNDTPIGLVEPKERDRDDRRPIIGMYRGIVTNGVPQRHVIVRLAYSDNRADAFLKSEARQLSKEAPGLIVLETTETRGSEQEWIEVFARRLHPGQHTRVGGILLISGGIETTPGGAIWKQRSLGVVNTNAAIPLPPSVAGRLVALV